MAIAKPPFYVTAYVVSIVAFTLATFAIPDNVGINADKVLPESATAALDHLSEIARLIGTLNTALVGACGALSVRGKDWSLRWEHVDGYLIVLSLVAAAASYYGAYLMHMTILQMAFYDTIDIFSKRLMWALDLQYYGTLLGLFLVGLVFVRMLAARKA